MGCPQQGLGHKHARERRLSDPTLPCTNLAAQARMLTLPAVTIGMGKRCGRAQQQVQALHALCLGARCARPHIGTTGVQGIELWARTSGFWACFWKLLARLRGDIA